MFGLEKGDRPFRRAGACALIVLTVIGIGPSRILAGDPPSSDVAIPIQAPAERPRAVEPLNGRTVPIPEPPTILGAETNPIDLNTALRLAGVQNPDLFLARQRVLEAAAFRQFAAAQILPTLNAGMNYDNHTGALQQSNGNILSLNRSAVYVGAGANAVGSGTVNIPGLYLGGNVGQGIYAYLAARQTVRAREFTNAEVANQVFLATALAYSELVRAEGGRAVAVQARNEAREIARLTRQYAATGEGRQADADRAATELARRESAILEAEALLVGASADLCRVLNLDPSVRLHPTDAYVVPLPIVPDPTPLCELLALALLQRPELNAQRASVREALLLLGSARVLPFSPTVLIGFSSGGFGGGSNLVSPVFGGFGARTDLDVIGYWTLQNMGVGNVAMIKGANARLQAAKFQEVAILNKVRMEVATSYVRSHARYAQIGISESGVRSALQGFREDYDLTRNRGVRSVLPIELLNNFRLLADSRRAYLDTIVDYNRAQFELFVALGQPPADALARPVPTEGIAPSNLPGIPSTASTTNPSATDTVRH